MKNFRVHLNGTAGDQPVLAMAFGIGRPFAAHLQCVHVSPNHWSLLGLALSVEMSALMLPADAIKTLRAQAEVRSRPRPAALMSSVGATGS